MRPIAFLTFVLITFSSVALANNMPEKSASETSTSKKNNKIIKTTNKTSQNKASLASPKAPEGKNNKKSQNSKSDKAKDGKVTKNKEKTSKENAKAGGKELNNSNIKQDKKKIYKHSNSKNRELIKSNQTATPKNKSTNKKQEIKKKYIKKEESKTALTNKIAKDSVKKTSIKTTKKEELKQNNPPKTPTTKNSPEKQVATSEEIANLAISNEALQQFNDFSEDKKNVKDPTKSNKNQTIKINELFLGEELEDSKNPNKSNKKYLEIYLSNYPQDRLSSTSQAKKQSNNAELLQIFILEKPNRLVVDIENGELNPNIKDLDAPHFIKSYNVGKNNNSLRLSFELAKPIKISQKVLKEFPGQNLQKIIIFIEEKEEINLSKDFINDEKPVTNLLQSRNTKGSHDILTTKEVLELMCIYEPTLPNTTIGNNIAHSTRKYQHQKRRIVIDAGHGGKDPGTIGVNKTQEKDLTLKYAKALKAKLADNPNYQIYLTRDHDEFLGLRKRVEKARKIKADLFISLHINWVDNPETKGFSIYTLSEKSSDKQAELLATKENRADIISGINFNGASKEITDSMIAMSQRSSMNYSSEFANLATRVAKQSQINILQNTHRFAGFAVLTAPDMASVLIELGYVSNQEEEEALNSEEYLAKITNSLKTAIDEYFSTVSILQ
jgi:N-acetylmuramoyl-L-alanine amidase